MKPRILVDQCYFDSNDTSSELSGLKAGIFTYKHGHRRKYLGYTLQLVFLSKLYNLTFVSNYDEYDRIVNRKYTCKRRMK